MAIWKHKRVVVAYDNEVVQVDGVYVEMKDDDDGFEGVDTMLARLGEDGWELVSAVKTKFSLMDAVEYLFKKEDVRVREIIST